MNSVRIKTTGKKQLRDASRDAVSAYFSSLPQAQRCKKWLLQSNRYRVSCTQQYMIDLKAIPSSVDHAALQAYLAASGPGHVIDGWSLLGRAIDATLRNDIYSAIHMAYYAELRAAMALLACEGIGIFNNRHPVIDAANTTQSLPKMEFWDSSAARYQDRWAGTHAIVWPCLKHWSGLIKSSGLFEETFRPAGLPLSEWLTRLGSAASARAVLKQWLSLWGLDLSILEDDHESRNLASYRPSEFRLPPVPEVNDSLGFIAELWSSLEPAAYGSFPNLERRLLKRALSAAGINGPFNVGALASVGINGAEEASWLAVLNSVQESRLLTAAEKYSSIDEVDSHLQVIARACMLLVLGTSASRRHLRKAGYSKDDLKFWWHRHGVERGLWEAKDDVEPIDLWADLQDCLTQVSDWCSNNGPGTSLCVWRRANGYSSHMLGAIELVGIWGLLP